MVPLDVCAFAFIQALGFTDIPSPCGAKLSANSKLRSCPIKVDNSAMTDWPGFTSAFPITLSCVPEGCVIVWCLPKVSAGVAITLSHTKSVKYAGVRVALRLRVFVSKLLRVKFHYFHCSLFQFVSLVILLALHLCQYYYHIYSISTVIKATPN